MNTDIAAAFDDLADQLDSAFGETVTYARPGGSSASVTAVWNAGRQEFDIQQTALTAFTAPQQGDTITRADGRVYDVALEYTDENGAQLPNYDIADGSTDIWRVHVEPVQS